MFSVDHATRGWRYLSYVQNGALVCACVGVIVVSILKFYYKSISLIQAVVQSLVAFSLQSAAVHGIAGAYMNGQVVALGQTNKYLLSQTGLLLAIVGAAVTAGFLAKGLFLDLAYNRPSEHATLFSNAWTAWAQQQPEKWIALQNGFKCCGFDSIHKELLTGEQCTEKTFTFCLDYLLQSTRTEAPMVVGLLIMIFTVLILLVLISCRIMCTRVSKRSIDIPV